MAAAKLESPRLAATRKIVSTTATCDLLFELCDAGRGAVSGRVGALRAGESDLVSGVLDGVGAFHGRPAGGTLVEGGLAEHGA